MFGDDAWKEQFEKIVVALALQNNSNESFTRELAVFYANIQTARRLLIWLEGTEDVDETPQRFCKTMNARLIQAVRDFRGSPEQVRETELAASRVMVAIHVFIESFMPSLRRGVLNPRDTVTMERAVQATDWSKMQP